MVSSVITTPMENIYSIDGIAPVVDPTAYVHPTATLIGSKTVILTWD